jgi:hypothetical protein
MGMCRRKCNPSTLHSGCEQAQVCTGWWYKRADGMPDTTGCVPFCHADYECAAGLHCDRAGHCRAEPVDLTLSPDGEPCDPSREPATGPSTQCRGECFPVSTTDPTQGLCGSRIDAAAPPSQDTFCPPDDGPDVIALGPQGDQLGLCVFKQCHCDADCTAPLLCITSTQAGQPGSCGYVDTSMGEHGAPCSGDAGADASDDASSDATAADASSPDASLPDAAAD